MFVAEHTTQAGPTPCTYAGEHAAHPPSGVFVVLLRGGREEGAGVHGVSSHCLSSFSFDVGLLRAAFVRANAALARPTSDYLRGCTPAPQRGSTAFSCNGGHTIRHAAPLIHHACASFAGWPETDRSIAMRVVVDLDENEPGAPRSSSFLHPVAQHALNSSRSIGEAGGGPRSPRASE